MTLKEFRAAPHDSRREVIAVRMVDALAGHLWVWGKKNAPAHGDPKSEREYRDALADRLPAFAVLESFESAVKMRSWIGRDEESISEDVRNFGGAFHADAFQSNAFQLGMAGVEDREGAVPCQLDLRLVSTIGWAPPMRFSTGGYEDDRKGSDVFADPVTRITAPAHLRWS